MKNVLDRAILDYRENAFEQESIEEYKKVDEIPFDFSRRMMSVVVERPDGAHRLLTKGAPEEIFRRCTRFELEEEVLPMDPMLIQDLRDEYERLSSEGFRVLAVAYKDLEQPPAYSKDEEGTSVRGYVAFLDPPKESAGTGDRRVAKHGVVVKILTGDNDLVSKKVCHEVGLSTEHLVLGTDIDKMSDAELLESAETTTIFARLSPAHKQRIIQVLRRKDMLLVLWETGLTMLLLCVRRTSAFLSIPQLISRRNLPTLFCSRKV